MPHLILECSESVANVMACEPFFSQLHQYLADTLPSDVANCKSRVIAYDRYYIGNNFEHGCFVHLTIKIMPGRASAIKKNIGQAILTMLHDRMQTHSLGEVSLSVELIDLSDHYFKIA